MDCFTDFAIFGDQSVSVELLRSFRIDDEDWIEQLKELKMAPGQFIIDFAKTFLFPSADRDESECLKELIIVFRGNFIENYSHAACFVRKDYCNTKQVVLLDCKNSVPLVHPKVIFPLLILNF